MENKEKARILENALKNKQGIVTAEANDFGVVFLFFDDGKEKTPLDLMSDDVFIDDLGNAWVGADPAGKANAELIQAVFESASRKSSEAAVGDDAIESSKQAFRSAMASVGSDVGANADGGRMIGLEEAKEIAGDCFSDAEKAPRISIDFDGTLFDHGKRIGKASADAAAWVGSEMEKRLRRCLLEARDERAAEAEESAIGISDAERKKTHDSHIAYWENGALLSYIGLTRASLAMK
jgi:hypothetical protein